MPIEFKIAYQICLAAYTVSSPLIFLWFHKNVLLQEWDGDMADRVTVRLYIISNLFAQALGICAQELW